MSSFTSSSSITLKASLCHSRSHSTTFSSLKCLRSSSSSSSLFLQSPETLQRRRLLTHSVGGGGAVVTYARPPSPADHVRDVFYIIGLSDKEIVALSGAHTLGKSRREHSGWGKPETKYIVGHQIILLNL